MQTIVVVVIINALKYAQTATLLIPHRNIAKLALVGARPVLAPLIALNAILDIHFTLISVILSAQLLHLTPSISLVLNAI